MFKKGDKVRCKIDYNGQFTKGKIYTIREDALSMVRPELDDKGSNCNGMSGQYFELVNDTIVFKVGDKVRCTYHYNDTYFPKGHVFLIEQIDITNGLVWGKGLTSRQCMIEIKNIELVQSTEWKGFSNDFSFKPKQIEKPCTCDSLILFRKGCQCGAIEKRQWGLRA